MSRNEMQRNRRRLGGELAGEMINRFSPSRLQTLSSTKRNLLQNGKTERNGLKPRVFESRVREVTALSEPRPPTAPGSIDISSTSSARPAPSP